LSVLPALLHAPPEDARDAARALARHLRDTGALLRRAAVRLSPAVEADLLEASAALTAALTQRRAVGAAEQRA
jgi:hypothetical protein